MRLREALVSLSIIMGSGKNRPKKGPRLQQKRQSSKQKKLDIKTEAVQLQTKESSPPIPFVVLSPEQYEARKDWCAIANLKRFIHKKGKPSSPEYVLESVGKKFNPGLEGTIVAHLEAFEVACAD